MPDHTVPQTTPEPCTSRGRQRRFAVLAATLLALGALALTACGSGDEDDSAATTTTAASGESSTTTAAGGSGSNNGGSSNGGGSGGGGGGGGGGAGTAPVIDTFETPDDIDCHNGNLQQFTVSWTTTNATRVTISIDGAGVYQEYGPDGDASLPFNCSSSHTFLLTAYSAGGQTATKQVSLEPRNAQGSSTTSTTAGSTTTTT
jgi:hypothetical protein